MREVMAVLAASCSCSRLRRWDIGSVQNCRGFRITTARTFYLYQVVHHVIRGYSLAVALPAVSRLLPLLYISQLRIGQPGYYRH